MKFFRFLTIFAALIIVSDGAFAACKEWTRNWGARVNPTDQKDDTEYIYIDTDARKLDRAYTCGKNGCDIGHIMSIGKDHWFAGSIVQTSKIYECGGTWSDKKWIVLDAGLLDTCDDCKFKTANERMYDNYYVYKVNPNVIDRRDLCKCSVDDLNPLESANNPAPPANSTPPANNPPAKNPPTNSAPPASNSSNSSGSGNTGVGKPPKNKPSGNAASSSGGASGNVAASVECNDVVKEWLREQKKEYYSCAGVEALANQILDKCEKKEFKTDDEVNKMTDSLEIMIKKCLDAAADAKVKADEALAAGLRQADDQRARDLRVRIANASGRVKSLSAVAIDRLTADAKSDYKTKRIISDSVAGVLLGTGGGFLANHIIKNNQLDSGFDSISCQIAGQTVAGWGDQFRIGYSN